MCRDTNAQVRIDCKRADRRWLVRCKPPHGSHDVHGSEYGKTRRTVGIIDFEIILRGDKRHGMLAMDVVARCRSRVPWVRDGYLRVKPSANSGFNHLYLGLSTQHKGLTRACLQLAPWDRWVWSPYCRSNPESLSAAARAMRAITAPYWVFGG